MSTPSTTYRVSIDVLPENATPRASPCEPAAAPTVAWNVRPGTGTFLTLVTVTPWVVLVGSIVGAVATTVIASPLPCAFAILPSTTALVHPDHATTDR